MTRSLQLALIVLLAALATGGFALAGPASTAPFTFPTSPEATSPPVLAGTGPLPGVVPALTSSGPSSVTGVAGATFRWISASPFATATPPARSGGTFVYDPQVNQTILFGGQSMNGRCFADTWALASGQWMNLTGSTIGTPPAVASASATYDPTLGGIVLFGGRNCATGAVSNATWVFRNDVWSNLTTDVGFSPPPLAGALLAYDAADGYDVLFGGVPGGGGPTVGATWVLENGSWTNFTSRAVGAPPAGCCGTADFDPGLGAVVAIYVPANSTGGASEQWQYAGTRWTRLLPSTLPAFGGSVSMAPVEAANGSVLFAGEPPLGGNGSATWRFGSHNWTNLTNVVGPGPSRRTGAMLAATGDTGTVALFGGYNRANETEYGDTWFLEYAVAPEVALTAGATEAEVGVPVDFTAQAAGSAPGPFTFAWAFGDGTGAEGNATSHSFGKIGNFTVRVTVTDTSTLFTNASSVLLHVVQGPAIAAAVVAPAIDVGVSDTFVASTSYGAPPLTYAWSFGDGESAAGATVGHAFAAPGNYSVGVTVIDAEGASGVTRVPVRVVSAPAVAILTPAVQWDAGVPVPFRPVVEGGVGPYTVLWGFGDGSSVAAQSANHTFAHVGLYPVTVSVRDAFGIANRATVTVRIVPPPTLGLGPSLGATDVGIPIDFAADVANGSGPFSITWAFGEGATATSFTPTHFFTHAGEATVTATLVDAAGAVIRRSIMLNVHADPSITVGIAPGSVRLGTPVALSASVVGGTGPFTFNWTLGDGGYATGPTAAHTYGRPGVYPVALEVVDAAGWRLTRTFTVSVQSGAPVGGLPGGSGAGAPALPVGLDTPGTPVLLALVGGAAVGLAVAVLVVGSWHRGRRDRGAASPLHDPVGDEEGDGADREPPADP